MNAPAFPKSQRSASANSPSETRVAYPYFHEKRTKNAAGILFTKKDGTLGLLQEMAREFPLFIDLLRNVEMALGKVDLATARVYAELVTDAKLRERIFDTLDAEFHRTVRAVLAITKQKELLETNRVLAHSIRLRNPYVDPMHLIQVDMLRRKRGGEDTPEVNRAIAALGKLGARATEISIPAHRDASDLLYAIAPEGMAMLARTNLHGTHHTGAYMPELAAHFGQHFPEKANDLAITVKFMLVFGNLMRERYHGKFYAKVQRYRHETH